ncbi:MAG: hypothetical protein CMJ18_20665 [Phycisphaeraceae bacterium]|nr:hypothetical protein [Phycisphaeraceae bacterium]
MERTSTQNRAVADLIDAALRYRWRLIVPAFLATTAVLSVSMILPRKHKAEAIFERRTRMVMEQMMAKGAPESIDMPHQSLAEEIAGETALDELFAQLGPVLSSPMHHYSGHYDARRLREQLKKEVVIRPVLSTKSLVRVSVSYVAEDPDVGRTIVNTLVRNYIERTRTRLQERLAQSAAFFESEVARGKTLIEDLENRKLAYEIEHADLLPDHAANHRMMISDLEAELSLLEQKRESARQKVAMLEQRLAATPKTHSTDVTAPNPELVRIEKKKQDLEAQAERFVDQMGMTDRHPALINLRQRIAEIDRDLDRTMRTVVTEQHVSNNPKFHEFELLLTAATADADGFDKEHVVIGQRIKALQADVTNMFPVRSDYRKLVRGIDDLQRQQAFWEDNLRRIRLTSAAENQEAGIDLDFIKPCTQINKPVSPNLSQVILVAIALGLMTGAVSVFSACRTDESFNDGEQLSEAVNLPLFGSVSEIISHHRRRIRRVRNMVLYPTGAVAMATVLVSLTAALYLSLEHPASRPETATVAPEPPQPAPDRGAERRDQEESADV